MGCRRIGRGAYVQPLPRTGPPSFDYSPFSSTSFGTHLGGQRTIMKWSRLAWCVALLLSLCHLPPMAAVAQPREAGGTPPVLAYYYQWFSVESWDRAKIDY